MPPPLQMGPLQGRLVLQNGQLILLNDNSQPNLLPGTTAANPQVPQNLLNVPGTVSSAGKHHYNYKILLKLKNTRHEIHETCPSFTIYFIER